MQTINVVPSAQHLRDTRPGPSPATAEGVVFARGLLRPGDTGSGSYYWDPSSTLADDGVTVFAVQGTNGRWRREGALRYLIDPDGDGWTAVLTATASAIDVTDLAVYDEIHWRIEALLNGASLATHLYGKPNLVNTGTSSLGITCSGGTVSGFNDTTNFRLLASGDPNRARFASEGSFVTKLGWQRRMRSEGCCVTSVPAVERTETTGGVYQDTTTPVTSWRFDGNVGNAFLAGTRLAMWGVKW